MKTTMTLYKNNFYSTHINLNTEKRTFTFARCTHDKFMRGEIRDYGGVDKIFIGRYVSVTDGDELLAYINENGEYSLYPAHKLPMKITKMEQIEQIQNYRGNINALFALWMI